MAAGGTGKRRLERDPRDQYPTPPWQTKVLLDHITPHGLIVEPCAGAGQMSGALKANIPSHIDYRLVTGDLFEPAGRVMMSEFDATDSDSWSKLRSLHGKPDWVITNPPFKHAYEILLQGYDRATFGVALILRTTFTEPTLTRGQWLSEHPPDLRLVLPRTKYRADTDSSDSVTTEWMVWLKANTARGTVVIPRGSVDELKTRSFG